jgi:maltooligosyltrehalose trehalohydrolase
MGGKARGEPSADLPPLGFVSFLQNHDQVGNRAMGERIAQLSPPERVSLAHAVLLLSPQIPMFFMGEEWDASAPFLYFVDFADDPALSKAVREGRRREFARFAAFADPSNAERIPDPTAPPTFTRSKLDWSERTLGPHAARLASVRELLRIRRDQIVPLLASKFVGATHTISEEGLLKVEWRFSAGRLLLAANFGADAATITRASGERPIWASPTAQIDSEPCVLPSWAALFMLEAAPDA